MRRNWDSPVTTIDLTHYAARKSRDLDTLEEFMDMKVVWKRDGKVFEYICGSGHPETLQFHSRSSIDDRGY